MKRILCATDLSPRAALAVDRAIALARQFSADLRLVHVVDDEQPLELVQVETERTQAALEARIARLDSPPVQATVEIRTGTVFQSIVEAARTWKADVVVLGAHRRRILRDVVVGTTIERVIRTAAHPVLMVNTATLVPYEFVLLALDTSEASARAVQTAHALGLLSAAHQISVVHAFEPLYKGMIGWAGVRQDTIDEYSATWEREAKEEITGFIRQLGYDPAAVSLVTEEGPPFASIKRTLEHVHPHLLVIGTHGRKGPARVLLGSVAERVISELECDILTVPPAAAGH